MLQKVLRLKQDGSDTYNFQILCPFIIKTRKTLSEHIENKLAERIDWLVAHTKDRDERTKQQPQSAPAQNQSYGQPTTDFDDDMPF